MSVLVARPNCNQRRGRLFLARATWRGAIAAGPASSSAPVSPPPLPASVASTHRLRPPASSPSPPPTPPPTVSASTTASASASASGSGLLRLHLHLRPPPAASASASALRPPPPAAGSRRRRSPPPRELKVEDKQCSLLAGPHAGMEHPVLRCEVSQSRARCIDVPPAARRSAGCPAVQLCPSAVVPIH